MSTFSFNNIKFNDIKLLSPDKLDNYYICNMKYNDELLYIQTPSLSIEEITQEYVLLKLNN